MGVDGERGQLVMRWLVAVAALSLLAPVPAEAAAPFKFGWPAGSVRVEQSSQYGPMKMRRVYDLALTATDGGYVLERKHEKMVSVEGPLTMAQVLAVETHMKPLNRPIEVDQRGVAVRVQPLDAAVFDRLKSSLPADPTVRAMVESQLTSLEEVAVADRDEVHEWNAVVGYWTGRDQAVSKPIRAKLPDGRVMVLEHLGPVADQPGARHLSVTVTGAKSGDVRGCAPNYLMGMEAGFKQSGATDTEVEHMLASVSCERTEVTEAIVAPATLQPHLVVLQWITVISLPGREPIERTSTVRRDYTWAKK